MRTYSLSVMMAIAEDSVDQLAEIRLDFSNSAAREYATMHVFNKMLVEQKKFEDGNEINEDFLYNECGD